MMQTVNISLTAEQSKLVNRWVAKFGYANRSEFFRSLLRLLAHRPQVLAQADALTFEPPNTRDRKEILESFRDQDRYSKAFLTDLEAGLKRSSYFKDTE